MSSQPDHDSTHTLYHKLAEDALDKGNKPLAMFYLSQAIRLSRQRIREALEDMRKQFAK